MGDLEDSRLLLAEFFRRPASLQPVEMWKIVVILTLLEISAAGLGAAEFYLGAGLGDEVVNGPFAEPLAEFGIQARDRSRKIYGGAELSRRLAIEAAYYDFGERICCPRLADAGFETELDGLAAALVVRAPFGRFEVFAKGGVLFWQEDGFEITIAGPRPLSADGSDPALGVGVAWWVLEKLALGAEWEAFELAGDSTDTFWLTARIGF